MSLNSLNDIPTINVKEQIRLRNEEVKRKEEAQYRLIAKTLLKNENSSISNIPNLTSAGNSNHSINQHSQFKLKKEDSNDGRTLMQAQLNNIIGQTKKHSSLYNFSSDALNISSSYNLSKSSSILCLCHKDSNNCNKDSELPEYNISLLELINDDLNDRIRINHLSEYFQFEYNDALRDALRTINMERKFEQRRRKNQDERWESLIKEGRGPSATELELQRKDREKIDIMSQKREDEVTTCVKKNFEIKFNFENEVKNNIDEVIKHWKGKPWQELIDFLEKGSNNDDNFSSEDESSEEEEEEEEEEENEDLSEEETSESEKKNEKIESIEEKAVEQNEKENKNESIKGSLSHIEADKSNITSDSENYNSSAYLKSSPEEEEEIHSFVEELTNKIKSKEDLINISNSNVSLHNDRKYSVKSLDKSSYKKGSEHSIIKEKEINRRFSDMKSNNVVETKEKEEEEEEREEDLNSVVNDVERSIQEMIQCTEELKTEIINQAKEKENKLNEEKRKESLEKIESLKDLTIVPTVNDESYQDQQSQKSLEIESSEINAKQSQQELNFINTDIEISSQNENNNGLNSAPAILQDDNSEKLISPNTVIEIRENALNNQPAKIVKEDITYIDKHQDCKALIYDYIKCKPKLAGECRSIVASEVIQMLDDSGLMRASESTPLVAEPGVSILKRIMKKLKKNKNNESEIDFQTINLFGAHLDILYDKYKDIPNFLKMCKKYIKARGLKKQGIFRISGRNNDIQDLKHKFQVELDYIDIGRQVEMASKIKDTKQRKDRINAIKEEKRKLQVENPGITVRLFELNVSESSVASIFKLFFRELIDPLFTFRMYKLWILLDEIHDMNQKIKMAAHLVLLLPFTHRLMLHYLLRFLNYVASYSSFNEMNSSNLAKVFGPNILRSEEKKTSKPVVELHEKANNVVEFLIENYEVIFREGSELIQIIEKSVRELYEEEDLYNANTLAKGSLGRSRNHFTMAKSTKSQVKLNKNISYQDEENRRSPLIYE